MGYCYICDHCGKLIKDTGYRIEFNAVGIDNKTYAASFNISESLSKSRIYCKDCMEQVKEFLRKAPTDKEAQP